MKQIVLASGNAHKIAELCALLPGWHIVGQNELGVPAVAETGLTFVENALLKARAACRHSGLPALADDSGLCVPALRNAPGLHSARYSGGDDAANNAKLLAELGTHPDRRAFYVCVLVYLRWADDPLPLLASGFWAGEILTAPRGTNGFGYDPLFFLPELGCSVAELSAEEKNRRSHRRQALQQLLPLLNAEAAF